VLHRETSNADDRTRSGEVTIFKRLRLKGALPLFRHRTPL